MSGDGGRVAVPGTDGQVSRQVLDDLLAPITDALLTVGADGRIGYAGPAVRHLTGFDPHTFAGRDLGTFLHPDDGPELLRLLHASPGPRPLSPRVRLRHADGGWREVTVIVAPSPVRPTGSGRADARAPHDDEQGPEATGLPDTYVPIVLRDADERRSTLDALRHRLAFEDLLTGVASSFLHRPAHELEACVADALDQIGRFAAVDRAYVYALRPERGQAEPTQEWTAPGVEPVRTARGPLPVEALGAWLHVLADQDAVYIPRVADLAGEWAPERATLEDLGVRATLAVAIADERRLVGFVGFDLVGTERLWSDDHIAVLSATAGIISQATARHEAEQRFGLAFDRAPLGMVLHDPEGRCLQVNPAFCDVVGRDEAELTGDRFGTDVDPADQEALAEVQRRLREGHDDTATRQLRFRRPDGTTVWCQVHSAAVRAADGSLRYTVSHVEDVTDRVRRDADLRASEARYRTLVENTPAWIVRVDRDLRVVYANQPIERLRDLLGDDPSIAPERVLVDGRFGPRRRRELEAVFDSGHRRDGEWEVPGSGGSTWFQSRAVPELGADGSVEHVLVVSTDVTALKRSEADLAHQALHDPLTGLANRALLFEHLDRLLARRADRAEVPALLFIDLDRFKLVNDSLGHRAGDELLITVARRLAAVVRPADLIVRLGGDEFVVVLDGVVDPLEPLQVARRIMDELTAPIVIGGDEVRTSGSIGIAMATAPDADAEGLLRDADAAMYLAKANGRNRYELFDTVLRTQATEKLQMESALRRALEDGGFVVHYQPELAVTSGEIVGFEALVRWNHPTEGRLPAWAFIELAEETGLILELGEWVLHEACRQAGVWQRDRPGHRFTLRVNLSRRQFTQADLVQQVVTALAAAELPASWLCLEITETALMADPARGLRVLQDLRSLGVELAIDDFGTGYSSLSYLKRFPVDVLKIDRSFVDRLGEDPDDTAIATAIISLARSMGMRVVAEGVETRRQLDELRRLGCDHAQGFLFAQPDGPERAWAVTNPYAPPTADPDPSPAPTHGPTHGPAHGPTPGPAPGPAPGPDPTPGSGADRTSDVAPDGAR